MKKKAFTNRAKVLLLTLGGGVLLAGTALADTLRNDLDASIDASLETLNLVEGGADGMVHLSVVARDGDGFDGCNLSETAALSVGVHSSDPAVATVDPASLSFTSCADVKTVMVHPVGPGSAEVTLSQTANGSAGSFNLSASSFAVVVAETPPVDTTPPVITPTVVPAPNAAGWNSGDVTVSWAVSDPESAIVSTAGCDTHVQSSETSGTTYTCSATSAGGMSHASVTVKLDETDPRVRIASPLDGASFTLHQEVRARWNAADALSGIAEATGTVPSGAMLDTSTLGEHTFTVTATDRAGNSVTKEVRYTVVAGDEVEHPNKGRNRVTVCHRGRRSITIGLPALRAHLRHGDTVGRCR